MDIIGPFPPAAGQRRFVIVAVDYFTKWVEAEALATITTQKAWRFFYTSVIMRFGIPRILITDNGTQFNSQHFKERCQELKIEQRFTSVAHPQTNGQTEVTNRTLLSGIKKRLEDAKGLWADELPHVLWAYRTTEKTATGETPFLLCYGTEAICPVEIGLESLRITNFNEEANEEGLRESLDALAELRERASAKMEFYKMRMARYHNRRVRERLFKIGDLVLRRRDAAGKPVGKLDPNWEGPFRIVRVVRKGTFHLEDMEGKLLPNSWNSMNLRLYHPTAEVFST